MSEIKRTTDIRQNRVFISQKNWKKAMVVAKAMV